MKISLSIDVSKIDRKRHIKRFGKEDKPFLKLTLVDHPSQYGDDGFASVYIPKEELEEGEKGGPIIGNWRWLERPDGVAKAEAKAAAVPQPAVKATEFGKDDDIPF
jgi:hypothetical protein